MPQTSNDQFAPDVLSKVFEFLPMEDVLSCSLVNKTWLDETSQDYLWESRAERYDITRKRGKTSLRTLYLNYRKNVAARAERKRKVEKIFPSVCMCSGVSIISSWVFLVVAFIVWLLVFLIVVLPE